MGSPNPTAPQDDDGDTTSNGVTATNDGTGFPGRISLPDVVVLKRRMPSADLGQVIIAFKQVMKRAWFL